MAIVRIKRKKRQLTWNEAKDVARAFVKSAKYLGHTKSLQGLEYYLPEGWILYPDAKKHDFGKMTVANVAYVVRLYALRNPSAA